MKRSLAALLLVACGGAGGPVDLDGRWPTRGGDYHAETRALTRRDSDRADMNLMVEAVATLKTPSWRAAYVEFRAAREGLSRQGRQALYDAEKQAAQAAHEVELLFTTYDQRSNDLSKGKRSVWRLTLVGEDGREVAPIEVVRDRRPRAEIKAYFPELGDFAEPYVARFPATADLFGDGDRRVVLRVASAQGSVELVWQDG